jgi:long-chain acyl-CoA synthetase
MASIYESKPWLKSYEKGVPENIKYEELTMPDYLEKSAKECLMIRHCIY